MTKNEFLENKIFAGLKNLNNGFDVPAIAYFSRSDFELVLKRCQENGVGITGIEPWPMGKFGGVKVFEDYTTDPADAGWYFKAFVEFIEEGIDSNFSATYKVPPELLS